MHRSLFSLASALAISSIVPIASAAVAGISPRDAGDALDKRLLCIGDSYNEVFMSVGMGVGNDGVQADLTAFCRSWIHIPDETSFFQTVTSTTTSFPATVTVESTTAIVFSATSTVTVTTSETNYALKRRSHVRKDKVHGRAPAPVTTPRAVLPQKMVVKARQVASSAHTRTLDVTALGAALSSACSCKMIPPLTTYLTSTAPAATRVIGATDFRTVTVNTTVADGVTTVTETLNVTSTIRPTGTGDMSDVMPTGTSNSTMRGTGTGTGTWASPTHPANDTRTGKPTRSYGTGTGGWPYPTKNSTRPSCSTGSGNITATVTAFATSTVISTTTDVQSAIIFRNQTITVTEGTVTITEDGATVTEPASTVTEFATTITLFATTVTEEVETITETLPEVTVTITVAATSITDPVVTETITDPAETSTVTVTSTSTSTEARLGSWYRPGRN